MNTKATLRNDHSSGHLIPGYRINSETGIVQGYRWGHPRKQALPERESLK